jgi:predicted amidophosphoribosyltransferase
MARAGAAVVLLDDVLTTGSTLAAVAGRLREAGVPVTFAATVAATRLRRQGPFGP